MSMTKINATVDYIPMAWNAIKIMHFKWNIFIVFLAPNHLLKVTKIIKHFSFSLHTHTQCGLYIHMQRNLGKCTSYVCHFATKLCFMQSTLLLFHHLYKISKYLWYARDHSIAQRHANLKRTSFAGGHQIMTSFSHNQQFIHLNHLPWQSLLTLIKVYTNHVNKQHHV